MADEASPPTEEELRAQLEEELKKVKVSDVLVQSIFTVSSLGYQRLVEEEPDLGQARLAIESLRALVPLLEGSVPEEVTRDLHQTVANLQLAYANAARAG